MSLAGHSFDRLAAVRSWLRCRRDRSAVEGRGPFARYDEDKGKILKADIARLIAKYDEGHPNKAQASSLQIQIKRRIYR